MALAALPDCGLREVCSYHYQLAVDQLRDATAVAYGLMETDGLSKKVRDLNPVHTYQ